MSNAPEPSGGATGAAGAAWISWAAGVVALIVTAAAIRPSTASVSHTRRAHPLFEGLAVTARRSLPSPPAARGAPNS